MQEIKNVEGAEKSLDLKRVLRILLKRAWLIIAVAVLFGMGGYLYSRLFIAPTYRASFTAYVNNRNVLDAESKTSSSDLSASMGLMYVYQEIIESRAVMTDAVILSKFLDGYLLAVREKHTKHRDVQQMLKQLQLADAKVLGFTTIGGEADKKKYYSK